jgi:alkylation response protein AidB-like acyl-CoA dehydrogenase
MAGLPDLVAPTSRAPASSLESVWGAYQDARGDGLDPFHAAVAVASRVDRLGFAFAVGYSAALERLVSGVELPCALCVTEAGGNHPRAIASTLEARGAGGGYVLNGAKTFVTFGNEAKTMIVAARAGERADGRPDISVVRIPADRKGVTLHELPDIPFVPEIPHARVELDDVRVAHAERLDGDGYLDYVKPFRTVEDIHVLGAAAAYALGLTRRSHGSAELAAELLVAVAALDRLREERPSDAQVHLTLHGVIQNLTRAFAGEAFAKLLEAAPAEERARWLRDQKLLRVANSAREARFQKAASLLGLC